MAGKVRHLLEVIEKHGGVTYYARLVVPKPLRPIVGKTELRASLGSSRSIALRDLPRHVGRFQDELAAARRKLGASSPALGMARRPSISIEEMARQHYAEQLALDEECRNADHRYASGFVDEQYVDALRRAVSGGATDDELRESVGWIARKFRERGATNVNPSSSDWRSIARTLAAIELEALARTAERDEGDYGGQPTHPLLTSEAEPERPEPVDLLSLFGDYIAELKASGRGAEAERRWRPVMKDLVRFLGHSDARRITGEDIGAWKKARLATLSAKTVRDVYIGAVRAVLSYAVENRRLPSNAAAGMTVRGAGKTVSEREKGFTDAEAKAVLKAASEYRPPHSDNPQTRESPTLTAAKRWAPWLCAYTGSRIAEITQLRGVDVREQDGITYLRITPAAGTVKTRQYRDVPLHPHLVDMGFLDFVRSRGDGPLFYDDRKRRKPGATAPAKHVAGRVGDWIRSLGVIDAKVAPNHGWRHRFKTVGIEAGMHARVLDALQGHAPKTAGDSYGDVTLKARAEAINRHPRYLI
jgi:integrase